MGIVKSIIFVLYLLSSIGIHIRLHYCCGQLADVHWGANENSHNTREDHNCCKSHRNCCRYEDITITNSEDHDTPQQVALKGHVQSLDKVVCNALCSPPKRVAKSVFISKEAPPPHQRKTYLVFCQRKSCDDMI